jgi:hypothetical protein
MHFWLHTLRCPKCNELLATQAAFSADGEVLFSGFCTRDNTHATDRVYASHLQWEALNKDLVANATEREKGGGQKALPKNQTRPRGPLQPPTAPPPPAVTTDDRTLAKSFGIDLGNEA